MTRNTLPPPKEGDTTVYVCENDWVETVKVACCGLLVLGTLAFLLACYGII